MTLSSIRAVLVASLAVLAFGCAAHRSATATTAAPPPATSAAASATDPSEAAARAAALLERATASLARGDDLAATTALREALALTPDSVPVRAALGRALYGLGDFDGALDELRAVLRRQPALTTARLDLASALMARRDWPAARAELDEALRREPDNVAARYRLGIVRYALGDLPGALAEYRSVIERRPDDPDARYNLALMLHLARRDTEAMPEFVAAAEAGLPRAQYFAAAAYASGAGVPRDLARAIGWYFRAADGGVAEAEEALAQLRQVAIGRGRRAAGEREGIAQAFRDYRESLWPAFPGLERNGEETVGAALVRQGRVPEAIPVLIREAGALGEDSERLLEALYADQRDPRILDYMRTAAAEGQPRARRFLQGQSAPAR